MIKSPLNYTGGKYKLLPQILPLFPKEIDNFIDLFAGGCNVGINVNANKIYFNDNLTYLINLYKSFKNIGFHNVLNHIERQINKYELSLSNEDGYNKLRKYYNDFKNPLDLFVLLSYSFNHQIRFNNKHQFNTSFGKDRSCFNENMKTNLKKFIDIIEYDKYIFQNNDFYEFDYDMLTSDDFVYLDPPYLITTGSYNDGKRGFKGWTEKEELQLFEIMLLLNSKNIKFGLSNVIQNKGLINTLLIDFIDTYKFNVNYINHSYSNCNYHALDKEINSTIEVLITNY